MSQEKINRRDATKAIFATIVAGSLMGRFPSVTSAEPGCDFSKAKSSNDEQIAVVTMFGTRRLENYLGTQQISSDEVGPSNGVDLRLRFVQDPNQVFWGTFKDGVHTQVPNHATLIQMGPVIDGNRPERLPLSLLGPEFVFKGNFPYDTTAIVERCGDQVEEGAWQILVERIVKENNVLKFRPEFTFGVVPDCGVRYQRYISVVRHNIEQVISTPTPEQPKPVEKGVPGIIIPQRLPKTGDGSSLIQ